MNGFRPLLLEHLKEGGFARSQTQVEVNGCSFGFVFVVGPVNGNSPHASLAGSTSEASRDGSMKPKDANVDLSDSDACPKACKL